MIDKDLLKDFIFFLLRDQLSVGSMVDALRNAEICKGKGPTTTDTPITDTVFELSQDFVNRLVEK